MNGVALNDVVALAKQAASRFRRYEWVDLEDATQEAVVAMLEVVTADIAKPDDPMAYLAAVAHAAVWGYTWSTLSPVKLGNRLKFYEQAKAARRESEEAALDIASDTLTPEESSMLHRWRSAVVSRFEVLMRNDPEIDKALTRRVLLHGERSEEAAVAEDVPVTAVYYVTQRMRKRIANDDELIHLLLDKLER